MMAVGFVALVLFAGSLVCAVLLIRRDLPDDYVLEKYASAPSRFVNLPSGARVHYRDEGTVDRPVLVLLHGFMSSLYDFDAWVPLLADRYRIIRLDLPGMGLTGLVPSDDYSQRGMAATLEEFLDTLGVERATLLGHSRGGSVAWAYAILYPQRVDKLVLNAASGLPFDSQEPRAQPVGFRIAETPGLKRIVAFVASRWFVREALTQMVVRQEVVTHDWVDRAFELSLFRGNRESILRLRPFRPDSGLIERMNEIEVPTLILWGKQDRLIPVSHAYRFRAHIPHALLEVYDGAAHYVQLESPRQSAADLDAFIGAGRVRQRRDPNAPITNR